MKLVCATTLTLILRKTLFQRVAVSYVIKFLMSHVVELQNLHVQDINYSKFHMHGKFTKLKDRGSFILPAGCSWGKKALNFFPHSSMMTLLFVIPILHGSETGKKTNKALFCINVDNTLFVCVRKNHYCPYFSICQTYN